MRHQRTIKRAVSFEGIGLHTGRLCRVTLKPADENTGITFFRKDRNTIIKGNVSSVVDTAFATTVGYNGTRIRTIEHLMAVLAGLGIDNLVIEVEGPEVPILDGSCTELVGIILEAGISRQKTRQPFLRIKTPVAVDDGHSRILVLPYEGRKITYEISFKHPLFSSQKLSLDLNEETFVREIAPARTFGFLKNVEMLRANGLAKGGSLDNAVVIGDEGVLNEDGLRFNDEFVRHKVLDLIGDIALLGYPVMGHIVAHKAGHSSHVRLVKEILSSVENWEFVSEEPVPVQSFAYL